MADQRPICSVLRDEALRAAHLLLERRLRPREALRTMRILDRLLDTEERLCRGGG